MSDLLGSARQWLSQQRKAHLSKEVTYRRGAQQSDDVSASIGRTEYESADVQGVIRRSESRDFIILVDDLPYGLPKRQDRIVETIGSTVFTYEILANKNEPGWRYTDLGKHSVRIHTKLVATDDA